MRTNKERAEFTKKMIYASFNFLYGFSHHQTDLYISLYKNEHSYQETQNHLCSICQAFIDNAIKTFGND